MYISGRGGGEWEGASRGYVKGGGGKVGGLAYLVQV